MKILCSLIILFASLFHNPAWSDSGSGGSGDTQPVPHYISHLVNSGQYAKAQKKLKYFIRNEKSSFIAWNLLAISQLQLGSLEASLKSHKKALRLKRNHVGANRSLGELYVALGDKNKAIAQLEKVEKLCGTCDDYVSLNQEILATQKAGT